MYQLYAILFSFLFYLNTCIAMDYNYSIIIAGTKIQVTKGTVYDADELADAIIIGKREQAKLDPKVKWEKPHAIEHLPHNIVRIIKKESDTDSVDENCDPRNYTDEIVYNFYKRRLKTPVFAVLEPKIQVFMLQDKKGSWGFAWDFVRQEAEEELYNCYTEALTEVVKQTPEKKERIIAFQSLSTAVGFPIEKVKTCALSAVFDFIEEYPSVYSVIQLFVKKRSEYFLYKKSLETYSTASCD